MFTYAAVLFKENQCCSSVGGSRYIRSKMTRKLQVFGKSFAYFCLDMQGASRHRGRILWKEIRAGSLMSRLKSKSNNTLSYRLQNKAPPAFTSIPPKASNYEDSQDECVTPMRWFEEHERQSREDVKGPTGWFSCCIVRR